MRLSSRALWALAASLSCFEAAQVADAGGVLEVDLAFPRNETYAPKADMPFVFAFQNGDPEYMRLLEPSIAYEVWDTSDLGADPKVSFYVYNRWEDVATNWSSHHNSTPHDPFLLHSFQPNFTEGTWQLI
jgi:hypothetical protein